MSPEKLKFEEIHRNMLVQLNTMIVEARRRLQADAHVNWTDVEESERILAGIRAASQPLLGV